MIVTDLLSWWYGAAWANVWQSVFSSARGVLDAFSVGLLARTLFAPFRQIDAGSARGSLSVQWRAWFDRTFSRFIGFGVRTVMIVSGCVSALFVVCFGLLWAVFWFFIPLLPIVGVFLLLSGWTIG